MVYNGRVEIFSCMIDIERFLKDGHTYRNMYDILFKEKKISMSYYHFCALLKKYNLKKINIASILSKKYKESLENKLKSLPEKEYNEIKDINISNLVSARDAVIQDKLTKFPSYFSNTSKPDDILPSFQTEKEISDGFSIIKKPEDEVF